MLLLATLGVYGQVRHYDFVNYDDPAYVTANSHVRAGLTTAGLAWAFTATEGGNWFPATWISHMIDCQLFGQSPGWHHLTNVLLHILSSLLLFTFLNRATGAQWPSALVAFLFALHPVHVESVAWVAERKDVLSAFFWFLTLWAYLRYVERPGPGRYGVMFLAFCLGLMSKPMLVTLPFVLLLLDVWPLHRIQFNKTARMVVTLIREKVPLFVVAIGVSAVTYMAQRQVGAVASLDRYPLGLRIENALASYVVYIAKMIWPSGLAVFYPYPALPAWQIAVAVASLSAASILVLAAVRSRPYLAVGWYWYIGTLLPVIGFVQVGSQSRADRYMYIPMVGLSIILAWGASDLLKRWPQIKFEVALLAAAACAAYVVLTWFQIQYWSGSEPLFRHTLAVTRANTVAHLKLAEFYLERSRFEDAWKHGLEAARLDPVSVEARLDLGDAFTKLGRHSESLAEYREAVRLQPRNGRAHLELSLELARTGQLEEALRQSWEVVHLQPEDADGHNNLGKLLAETGRTDEAIAQFSDSIRLEPDNADFHYNLGDAFAANENLDDAIREFGEAIRLKPEHAVAHFNLGTALALQGRLDEAIAQFTAALRLNPDLPGARQSLEYVVDLKRASGK